MKIDFRNISSPRIKENGLNSDDFNQFSVKAASVKTQFLKDKSSLDFVKLLEQLDVVNAAVSKAKATAAGMRAMVIIGIGGSDLGARAIFKALNHTHHNLLARAGKLPSSMEIYFLGDTTDPVVLQETLDVLPLAQTLFLVVSKSGNTIEQASTFVYLRDQVLKTLGMEAVKKQFLLLTDPQTGALRELANREGYATIDHPEVGGRFSVLSVVGMVPAALMGHDPTEFLRGARDLAAELDDNNAADDFALTYAAWHYLYASQGKSMTVLMPYIYNLCELALWFRQLWGESLGKKVNNQGQAVYAGTTPVAALGPTDQHSQLQLYNEGPNDKVFTLLTATSSRKDIDMPTDYSGVEAFSFFSGRKLHEVLNLELETTAFALTQNSRPNLQITIPILDAYNLGKLFYFFELVTAYMGYFYDINTYDQPGVELSKNAMFGVLGKPGYEKNKSEFEQFTAQS